MRITIQEGLEVEKKPLGWKVYVSGRHVGYWNQYAGDMNYNYGAKNVGFHARSAISNFISTYEAMNT